MANRRTLSVVLVLVVVAAAVWITVASTDQTAEPPARQRTVEAEESRGSRDRLRLGGSVDAGRETRPAFARLGSGPEVLRRPVIARGLSYEDELERYGRWTVPALRSPERVRVDHQVERTVGNGLIATQNRSFLSNNEHGVFRLIAADPDAALEADGADLVRLRAHATNALGPVPAQRRTDVPTPTVFGTVSPEALEGRAGTLRVRLRYRFEGEPGEVSYDFDFTGQPPAVLAGVRGPRVTDGDFVFDLGVTVRVAGTYAFEGRIVNTDGFVVALIKARAPLDVGARTAALTVDGLFAREWMALGDYVLTNVEAWRLVSGGMSPREVVIPWRGRHGFSLSNHDGLRTEPRLLATGTTPAARTTPVGRPRVVPATDWPGGMQ